MDDPRARAPHGLGHLGGAEAAGEQPARGVAPPERGRVALEHLDLLAELRADEPGEVGDRPLLPAGNAIAVVQEQDHPAPHPNLPAVNASILVPTRGRPAYLAVALASVAPQAEQHGAEIIVVEDGPANPETERVARDARYIALGGHEGLNRARNAAAAHATGDLLCFLDDDIEAWPGWLGALLTAAQHMPEHEAFGGPIRARLEGSRLRLCGREPAPVTTLDLGPEDRDAPLVWGANLAVRRSALARVGPFDPARSGPGDEEEWERRLTAAGGRIRYVAAAGVDHRRAGADARLAGLSRAAWHRGRQGRRFDAEKGTTPGLGTELRTLAGCAWHTGRYACGNGIVLERAERGPRVRGAGRRQRAAVGDRPALSLGPLGHARPPRPAGRAGPRRRRRHADRPRAEQRSHGPPRSSRRAAGSSSPG